MSVSFEQVSDQLDRILLPGGSMLDPEDCAIGAGTQILLQLVVLANILLEKHLALLL